MQFKLAVLLVILPLVVGAQVVATATLSPGLNVGQGVYNWGMDLCNVTQSSQVVPAPMIRMAAVAAGLSVVSTSEAQMMNTYQRNSSRFVIGSTFLKGGAMAVTGAVASDIIPANATWGAVAAGSVFLFQWLSDYFKGRAALEFNTRFGSAQLLPDRGSITLQAKGSDNSCESYVLFSRTKRGAAPMKNVQIGTFVQSSALSDSLIQHSVALANAASYDFQECGVCGLKYDGAVAVHQCPGYRVLEKDSALPLSARAY